MKLARMFCILAVLALISGASSANFMALRDDVQGEKPDVVILQHNDEGIQLEIKLPGVDITETTLEGKNWDRVEIPGGARGFDEMGAPEVPHFTRLLIIPATKGVSVDYEELETSTLPNVELMPTQEYEPEEQAVGSKPVRYDVTAYSRDALYPAESVKVSEPAVMRGLRVVALRTNPVQYNPVSKELHVATRYRVTVHFEGTDLRSVPSRQIPLAKTWAKMMRAVSFNLDDPATDEQDMGSYLIVCVNNSTLLNDLQNLIDWKKRKGHSVTVQTFASGASATTIKSLIQTAYNTWPTPPEYVLLVGGVSGTYQLPSWSSSDHPYAQLDGGDVLEDVAVGRLPTTSQLQTQVMVNKILYYEKMPYTGSPNWFGRSALVANYQNSLSMTQVNRWIKTRMLEAGFTQVDTFFSSSSAYSWIISHINNGVTYFNYRGWLGMGGFDNSDINNLTNGRMLPFATILTCGTGGFSGSSNMETFVFTGTSPTTPRGAIAAVGLSGIYTEPPQNNIVDYGIYAGLFDEGITQAGTATVRGKLELYNAYQTNYSSSVSNWSSWCGLAGDPGVELFTGPLQYMNCTVPDQVTLGQNSIALTVNQSSGPALEGATACLYKAGELQSVGTTDANGQVTLPLSVLGAGNVKVTITKHNYFPIVDSLDVVQTAVAVGYFSHTIDDDNAGGSSGDNDGIINPGEVIQIPSVFKNYGTTTTATNVSATASENDPFVALANATQTFPDLAPGATGNSSGSFLLTVANNAPNGYVIPLGLNSTSSQGSWPGLLPLNVVSFDMFVRSAVASGSDTLLSPGETANFIVNVRNNGAKNAASLTATLVSLDPLVTVNDNSGAFGTVNIGASASCSGNPFNLTAASTSPPGHLAQLKITFGANAAIQVDTLTIALGPQSMSDPQGPDAYGYWCFDNTDLNYTQCPTYNWVEIDPGYGGSGTQLAISDPSEDQDKSVLVNLPFTFRYYGQTTNQITVCSNGWISYTGNVSFTDFRNHNIPTVTGPYGIICPFWDDLITSPGHVFSWNDATNHRFIVEWSRMNVRGTSTTEVFEAILYDPAYYPTPTQDGEIVFQYNTIADVPGVSGGSYQDNSYSTVGIESPDQTTGIEVSYWATYDDVNAAHLQNGRAYKFTTAFQYNQPASNLDITLTPVNPPIQIPSGGGSFNYNITLHNNGTSPATFDVWIMQRLPDGTWQGPMLGPVNILLSAGGTINRTRTQNVPARAQAGIYNYVGYVGVYSNVKLDSSYFTYTKLAGSDGGPLVNNWENWGQSFDPWLSGVSGQTGVSELPDAYALHPAYPNPFNPTVTLAYDLPQAGHVRLAVYDVQGRLVASLVDGMREAGRHEAAFDGSGFASGIYVYRLAAGEYVSAGKMVLMK